MKITDKMRLDWMSKQGRRTIRSAGGGYGNSGCAGWDNSGRDFIFHAEVGGSLRRVVDAAIRAKGEKRGL